VYNSDIRRIFILTRSYKVTELNRHIRDGWQIYSSTLGEFIEVLPPMKVFHEWYQGAADRRLSEPAEAFWTEAPEFRRRFLSAIRSIDGLRDMLARHIRSMPM